MDNLHITKDNGEIVSHKYVVRRVSSALSRWRHIYTLAERRAVFDATVNNPEWMRRKRGQTVGSIVREVEGEI
jgi:hypothetical protein